MANPDLISRSLNPCLAIYLGEIVGRIYIYIYIYSYIYIYKMNIYIYIYFLPFFYIRVDALI